MMEIFVNFIQDNFFSMHSIDNILKNKSNYMQCELKKKFFWPGSNWRHCACEAHVITTTLQKRKHSLISMF